MSRIDKLAVDEATKEMLRKESDRFFETMVKLMNTIEKTKSYKDVLYEVEKVVFETSLDANERERVVKALKNFGRSCMYQGYEVRNNKSIKSKLKNILKVR